MQACLTRDSVHAGDDADAPHGRSLHLPDGLAVPELVLAVAADARLPGIAGGRATWGLASNVPLAVLAQEWPAPRLVLPYGIDLASLDLRAGVLHLHLTYFAQ